MDINNNATGVYKLNHPKSEKDVINGDINNAMWEKTQGYNTLVMSPPCQPFTRNGKQKDTEDNRTKVEKFFILNSGDFYFFPYLKSS